MVATFGLYCDGATRIFPTVPSSSRGPFAAPKPRLRARNREIHAKRSCLFYRSAWAAMCVSTAAIPLHRVAALNGVVRSIDSFAWRMPCECFGIVRSSNEMAWICVVTGKRNADSDDALQSASRLSLPLACRSDDLA